MIEDVDDEEEDEEEEEEEEKEEEKMDSDREGMAPTAKKHRLANKIARTASLKSGLYPEFLGIHGPSQDLNPNDNSALDYLLLLWPASLCNLIADETDRYTYETGTANWRNTSTAEIWTFLDITILMCIKRLPSIKLYWSGDALVSVPTLIRFMSRLRFWALWHNLHVIGGKRPAKEGVSNKIKTDLDTLSRTFLECYSPAQELSVDESMIKYKGYVGDKVCMPRKPVKQGFKVWCCSCSCCGYLCTFQIYRGAPTNPVTGEKTQEKGLAKRVVGDLVAPFTGVNHVVY